MIVASVEIASQAAPMAAVLSLINCVSFIRFSVERSTEKIALKNDTVFSRSERDLEVSESRNPWIDQTLHSRSVDEFSSSWLAFSSSTTPSTTFSCATISGNEDPTFSNVSEVHEFRLYMNWCITNCRL